MKLVLIISSCVLIIFLAVFFTQYDARRIKDLHSKYTKVQLKDEIAGRITDLYVEKGTSFIVIDSVKLIIKASANYLYREIYFDHMLSIGDSIIKYSGSDTIYIYKENIEYYFVLGKFINIPPTTP